MTENPFADVALPNPSFSEPDAAAIAEQRFGLVGRVRELGSHQDQNFLVTTERDGRFVLKVANPGFERIALDAQNAAMGHLTAAALPVVTPRVVLALDGADVVTVDGHDIRVVTFVAGSDLQSFAHLAPTVRRAVGAVCAHAVRALADFDHPGLDRVLQWDSRQAGAVIEAWRGHVPDRERRDLVGRIGDEAGALLEPLVGDLRSQAIHGDITDVNLMVERGPDGRPVPIGLIDLGDLVRTWLVSEVAVAAASLVPHDLDDPLAIVCDTVAGHHAVVALTEAELAAVWPLVLLRAAVGATSSELQHALDPANAYVAASLAADRATLDAVTRVPPALASAALRGAVGLDPLPGRRSWADHRWEPVVATTEWHPVDLSVLGDRWSAGAWEDPSTVRADLASAAPAASGWGEGRLVDARPHRRTPDPTVHLGVDLFVDPATAVATPVAGRVRRVSGGIVVAAGDHDVRLVGISPSVDEGDVLAAGDAVGVVAPAGPGPLPAHLHVQLVAVPGLDAPGLVPPRHAHAWRALCPDPRQLLGLATEAPSTGAAALLARRHAVIPPSQEQYYEAPPRIERGWREHLYDIDGRVLLDAVNNVTILGHGHPAVEAAVARQLRVLNTNSRFNHEAMVRFAERLADLLPDPLDTVFLVSTGSESVDLALRLVRTATGRKDVFCVAGSYHGWTTATDEVTTSLGDNPNARTTRPPWIHVLPAPDPAADPASVAADASDRIGAVAAERGGLGGVVAEALFGNAGGMVLPDGYLAAVYGAVREAGGLCIADEVQVGYGRLGSHFWAFEQQGVVPDVVTLAKATGNGFPVAAVVTTRAVAEAFAAEGSFFSSMGGTPAAAVAGLAVLDTLEAEDLPGNARRVGAHLAALLREVADRHPNLGAVHGMGLYLGVEVVDDAGRPSGAIAAALCERLLELGVVVTPTGDHRNMLKVKPPLCFTVDSADFLADALDNALTDGW